MSPSKSAVVSKVDGTLVDEKESKSTETTNAQPKKVISNNASQNADTVEEGDPSHTNLQAKLVIPSRQQLVSWLNTDWDASSPSTTMLGVSYQDFRNIMHRKGWASSLETRQHQEQQQPLAWWQTPVGNALRSTGYTFSYNVFDPVYGNVWLRRRDPKLVITLDMARDWLKTYSPNFDRLVGHSIAELYALIEFQHQDVAPYHFEAQLPHVLVHPVLAQLVASASALIGADGSILRYDPIVLSLSVPFPYQRPTTSVNVSSSSSPAPSIRSDSHSPNKEKPRSEHTSRRSTTRPAHPAADDVAYDTGGGRTRDDQIIDEEDEDDVIIEEKEQHPATSRSRSARKRATTDDEGDDEVSHEHELATPSLTRKRPRFSSTPVTSEYNDTVPKDLMPLASKDQFVAWLHALNDPGTYQNKHFTTLEGDFTAQTQTYLRPKAGGRVSEHVFIPAALAMHGLRLYTGKGRQVFIGKAVEASSSDDSTGIELAGFLRSTVYYLYHRLLPQLADVTEHTVDVEQMYFELVDLFKTEPHLRFVDVWGLPRSTNRLGHNMTFLKRLHPVQSTAFERHKHGTVTRYTFYSKDAEEWIRECYKDLQSTDERL